MKKILMPFSMAMLGGFIAVGTYQHFEPHQQNIQTIIEQPTVHALPTRATSSISGDGFVEAAEMTVHSVVHVKTEVLQEMPSNPYHEFFFGTSPNRSPRRVQGAGSGVIIRKDGYIVTNNHVIQDAEKVSVTLNDNRTLSATVIGTDPTTDLAVIKVEGDNFPALPLSNSDDVKLGEWVLAVGNPFNLNSTVTAGIISATGRNINIIQERTAIESFIQTDAVVNPGNSGGALVNTKGELVGINTAITTHTGSYEGYSFAIPSNIVNKVVSDILEFGTVQRAFLGVSIKEVTAEEGEEIVNGVLVAGITPGSGADDADLQSGDIIIQIDEKEITKSSELMEKIGSKRPGDKANIKLVRDGEEKTVVVQLKNNYNTTALLSADDQRVNRVFGADFENLNKDELAKLKIENGIRITTIRSGKLRKLGVPEGFIIQKVNQKPVNSIDELTKAIKKLQPGDGILLQGLKPNGQKGYYAMGL